MEGAEATPVTCDRCYAPCLRGDVGRVCSACLEDEAREEAAREARIAQMVEDYERELARRAA
jgi:uncharacterized Zn finger protein (UPF0148 family)